MAEDSRVAAGRTLAQSLLVYQGRRDAVIVAVTPAALSVARGAAGALNVPFDVFLVRKIAAGAVARGAYVPSAKALRDADVSLIAFVDAAKAEELDIERVEAGYREGRRPVALTSKTVILIDDGTSTPDDLLTAMTAIRRHGVTGIVVVAPLDNLNK